MFLKTGNCYSDNVWKTSSRYVLKTTSIRFGDQQIYAGLIVERKLQHKQTITNKKVVMDSI